MSLTKEYLRAFVDKCLSEMNASPEIDEKLSKDIITNDDGYRVYWPETRSGYLDEYMLLYIFCKINKLNREWDDHVDDFFSGLKT